jgi:hypothetical protein
MAAMLLVVRNARLCMIQVCLVMPRAMEKKSNQVDSAPP